MSLPREILDELLSRYMDGELSADEQARVEQILSNDPEAQNAFETLRSNSSLVRRVVSSTERLPTEFAARVFQAAVTEAESSNLAPAHPLVLAAKDQAKGGLGNRGAIYASLLALAASLLLAAFFLRGENGGEQVATNNLLDGAADAAEHTFDQTATINQPEKETSSLANDATGADTERGDNEVLVENLESTPRAMVADAINDAVDSRIASSNAAPSEMEAAVSVDATPSLDNVPAGMKKLRAVMVLEVLVSATGRENNVLGRVFKDAGIRVGDEREVGADLVGHLRSSGLVGEPATELVGEEEGAAKRCQVIFLEGSGLALEQAMFGFLNAAEDVRQVGFNLMMDGPIFAAIDELSVVDATKVRADQASADSASTAFAQSLSPSGYTGAVENGFTVGTQRFMPLDAKQSAMLSQFSSFNQNGKANDITSQVLVIVRFE